MKRILLILILLIPAALHAQQIMVSGMVMDSSRQFILPAVKVRATNGNSTYTDSTGQYSILVSSNDSINFTYLDKSTIWFPVRDMKNTRSFDIALQVTLKSAYKTLKEVIVYKKSYKQDSVENRIKYQKIFNANTGQVGISSGGGIYGGAGLDPNDIINLFRFRRNKSLRVIQNRLIQEEQDKFIDYRFNKDLVKQITGFVGTNLDRFMKIWRPDYEWVAMTSDIEFHTWILEASKAYTRGELPWIVR